MLTSIFEVRKKIIEGYGQFEYIVVPAFKFAVAFLLILTINKHIGFNQGLTNQLLDIIIALICTLVPVNFMAGIMVLLILAHLYTLSLEAMIVGAVIFLLMFLLYFRFSPKDTMMILLLPLAFTAHLEFAVPVAAGLLFGPGSAVGVGFSVLGLALMIWAIVEAALGKTVAGWASTVCIICLLGGIQLISLGIIGQYIGKTYLETKHRPRYIISSRTWEPEQRHWIEEEGEGPVPPTP